MDPILAGIIAEMTKAVILAIMQESRRKGMTVDEIEEACNQARDEFRLNNPEKIPDV